MLEDLPRDAHGCPWMLTRLGLRQVRVPVKTQAQLDRVWRAMWSVLIDVRLGRECTALDGTRCRRLVHQTVELGGIMIPIENDAPKGRRCYTQQY